MRSRLFWCGWHCLAAVALLFFPGLMFSKAPWLLSRADAVHTAVLLLGYPVGAVFLHARQWLGEKVTSVNAVQAGLAAFVPSLVVLLSMGTPLPGGQLTATVLAGTALLSTPFVLRVRDLRLLSGLAASIPAGLAALSFTGNSPRTSPGPSIERVSSATDLYSLELTYYRGFVPHTYSGVASGGITDLGDGGLLVTGDGDAYYYQWGGGSLTAEPLPFGTPMNRQVLIDEVGTTSYIHYFRVLDVVSRAHEGRLQVLVSYDFWHAKQQCFAVRVSVLEVASLQELRAASRDDWRTVYETQPCLKLQTETDPGWPFRGMEGGGRMGFLDEDHLLLSVGDQGFNGVDFGTDLVDDPSASYGKTILVSLDGGGGKVYSTGHRNPQGLWVVNRDSIWLTEHGPKGGDELNLISEGGHYGWPHVTYGTDYGTTAWPLNEHQGRHEDYQPPIFAWVPSVGVSAVKRVSGGLFSLWDGDLLIASLVGETLFRARMSDGHLRYLEPIRVGEPIRDLYVDGRGRIVLWTDRYSLVTVTPSTMAFAACSGCHTIGGQNRKAIGPDLGGVLGRDVASVPGYQYSDALRSLDGQWSRARLDRFLADPQAFAPGNKMLVEGINDPAVRKAVIDYLQGSS